MTVRVEPDPGFAAGHARVVVTGAAGSVSTPGLRIQREEDWGDDKLGPGGWQTTEAVLQPDRAEGSGGDLVLHLGWTVCQHLEAGMYSLWVPGAGVEGAAVYWPDIVPMHAGAVSVVTPAEPAAAPASPPSPSPPPRSRDAVPQKRVETPQPPPLPPTLPPPAPARRSRVGVLSLLALLVLLAAGGGAAWWWRQSRPVVATQTVPDPSPTPTERPAQPPATPPATPPVTTAEAPPAPPQPLDLGRLSVPEVLTQAPNPAAVAAEGTRRLEGGRKDDGVLLLESAADRGDAGAAAALARLYDPVLHQPGGPIPRPDPRQAARLYRDAARAGADVAAPREALRKELERRSAAGDLGAGLSLKDFWP